MEPAGELFFEASCSPPPEEIYSHLSPHLPWLQWLDGESSSNEEERRSIWVWDPAEICVPLDWELKDTPHGVSNLLPFPPIPEKRKWRGTIQRCENPFPHLQQRLREARKNGPDFYAGWYGLAGYELGSSLLGISPEEKRQKGDFWFGYYENVLLFEHATQKYFLRVKSEPEKDFILSLLSNSPEPSQEKAFQVLMSPGEEDAHYRNQLSRIRNEITRGNVYQVNYSTRFLGRTDQSPQAIFKTLRKKSPVPYAVLWNTGECFVFSLSPELFLKGREGQVSSRPIKGTAARSKNPHEDEVGKNGLLHSEKDRAELLMIVDLVRNDLGRVCAPGSVRVPELFGVESYSTVHHLVSTVTGRLAPDKDAVDAFCALFPAGSIVGAPKIAAARLIAELEKEPRRFYTGCVGYFLNSGDCLFNVAIRTFTLQKGLFTAYSGGGIVIDSDPAAEYAELCAKVGYLFA